jgi:hypothetical protein
MLETVKWLDGGLPRQCWSDGLPRIDTPLQPLSELCRAWSSAAQMWLSSPSASRDLIYLQLATSFVICLCLFWPIPDSYILILDPMADSDNGSGRYAPLLCALNDINSSIKKFELYVTSHMEEWDRRRGNDSDESIFSGSASEYSGDVSKANSIERKDHASAEEKEVNSKPSQDKEHQVSYEAFVAVIV